MECSLNSDCDEYENCNGIYTNLSDEMINYLMYDAPNRLSN